MKKINPDKYGIIISVITKDYVDSKNFEDVQNFYSQMLDDPLKYENKVVITIDGYGNDDRELFEIQEIRDYFLTLDRLFPYWFYFIDKRNDTPYSPLKLIMMLLVPSQVTNRNNQKNTIEYDIPEFIKFMESHFHYLNELTDKLGLPLVENKRITEEVLNCFK